MEQSYLDYIGNVTLNGFPGVEKRTKPIFTQPEKPKVDLLTPPTQGTKQILDARGADGLVEWIKAQEDVLINGYNIP